MSPHTSRRLSRTVGTLALTASCLAAGACGTDTPSSPTTTETAPPTADAAPRSGTLSPSSTESSSSSSSAATSGATAASTTTPSTTTKSGPPRGGLVTPSDVNPRNAKTVADAYVRTTLTFDTRVDASYDDAHHRARRWMTDALAPHSTPDEPGDSQAAGTGWDRLRADDAWTRVATKDVTQPGQDPTKGRDTERIVRATVITSTSGSKKPEKTTTTFSLTLTRQTDTDPWRVSEIQTY